MFVTELVALQKSLEPLSGRGQFSSMTNQRILPALILLVAVSISSAAAPPRKTASVEGITEYQFDNGLRALLYPDKSRSKVSVNMTVLVGSRHEGYGEAGMAHLLEHMVFKGTPTRTNIPKSLNDHGASWNGSTSPDRTNYYETMAADDENLEFAIALEADRLVNSVIRREDLDSEMTVVRNEFERGENSAAGVLGRRISAAAYEWHNYGKSTIGNRSDIERVPIENLRAFYRKFYQPDNVVLVIAGKFDEAKALALIEKHFGAIPKPARKLDTTWTEEPAQDGERLVTLRRVSEVGSIGVAYHIPAAAHEDMEALQVLGSILSTRPTGRLYKALVESKKATSAGAFARAEHDPGLFSLSAGVPKDGSIEEVRDLLLATVEKVGAEGVTDEEVSRAKQNLLKNRELAASDVSQLGVSLSEWISLGDWRLYFLHRDRLEQVTPAAVKSVAEKYLRRNNRTVGMLIPTAQPERVSVPPTPDVYALVAGYQGRAAVAEGEEFEATPANVESRVKRLELPEGIKATLLQKKSRGEEVHLSLTLRYGDEKSLKEFEGATGFLGDQMMHGTKKMTEQQMHDELDKLKATLGSGFGGGGRGGRGGRGGGGGGGGLGSLSFSITAKRDTLPAVLEILKSVLREPLLPTEQFEIAKRGRLNALEASKGEPSALAPQLLSRTLSPYPKDDIRYAPTTEESIERLKAVTHDKVVKLHREFLGSGAGELTIVGDFDEEKCLAILRDMFKDWKSPHAYARIASPAANSPAGSSHKINTPDKANATFLAGMLLAVRDDDADYPALLLGNYILGSGALSSRLGTRIRQQEGLSYSVGSSLGVSSQDKRATFTMSAICNPANIGRVEKCAREELARMLKDGVTQTELDQARQGYLQAVKVGRSSDPAIMGQLGSLRNLGRTMAWQTEQEKRILALTPETVLAALRKHLDPSKLVVVTAGDFEAKAGGGQ